MQSAESERWRWKLRLFVSTDLVGSTIFKSTSNESSWSATFKEFFEEFPSAIASAYHELTQIHPKLPSTKHQLQTWKFSGDEILFWAEIDHHREVLSHLMVIKRCLANFPTKWRDKGVPLKLKGSAWLGGFPVTNTEINLSVNGSGDQVIDFIGPSIDTGFRVARYCDERKFAVTADLALMILDAVESLELPRKHFRLHLHGCEILKGVIANQPYPVFWIDMLDGQHVLEEKLLGIRREFYSDDIKDYLREFIDQTKKLRRPFIVTDPDPRYNTPDPELDEIRRQMEAEESSRLYELGGEQDQPANAQPKHLKDPNVVLQQATIPHCG